MKTMILAITTLFATLTFSTAIAQNQNVPNSGQSREKMMPGDPLPPAGAPMKNASTGNDMLLQQAMKKNGLLVMFSCNTCPFVVKNQPITKKTMEYALSHDVGMVIVNSNEAKRGDDDSYTAMKHYAKEQGYTVPYVVDENSALADQFGASHTPEVYLFDKTGHLMYKGAMNDNPGDPGSAKKMYIEDAINAIVAGKEVEPKTTKSVGCGIKRRA